MGYYINQCALSLSKKVADAKRVAAALQVEDTGSLDVIFRESRLPSRASRYRALQAGGWLAERYNRLGEPWPHVAAALDISLIPTSHSVAIGKGFYAKRVLSDTKVTTVYGTRSNSRRSKRRR